MSRSNTPDSQVSEACASLSPLELSAVQCRLNEFMGAAKRDRAVIIKTLHDEILNARPDGYSSRDSKTLKKVRNISFQYG